MAYHGGFNTAHGADQGPPPPGAGAPWGMPFQPQYQQPCMQPYAWPQQPQMTQPPFFQASTHPAPPPINDGGIPGIHLRNHTGGVGVPPTMQYLFPKEHCTLRLLRSTQKPWQMADLRPEVLWLVVPVNMSVKEFMQQIGLNNDDAKMNVLCEVTEKGNGSWSRGIRIPGDDKDKVKKSIRDFGWNAKRTFPPVTLWASMDGS